jgi:hypothetical protein
MGASQSKDPSTAATVSGRMVLMCKPEENNTSLRSSEEKKKTNSAAAAAAAVSKDDQQDKENRKKLSLVSVHCTLSTKNELTFMFYPFYPTEDDMARMDQGFSPDEHTERPSPDSRQFKCCPWVSVHVTLIEQEMVKNIDNVGVGNFVPTLNVVNGLVATEARIQANWFVKRGHSQSFTVDLPSPNFSIFQNSQNKSLVLEWKSPGPSAATADMEWDIITNPICYVVKQPDAVFWHPDKSTKACMRCYRGFGLVNRRHHCRACGKVVCTTCSNFKSPIKQERICYLCNDMEIFRAARRASEAAHHHSAADEAIYQASREHSQRSHHKTNKSNSSSLSTTTNHSIGNSSASSKAVIGVVSGGGGEDGEDRDSMIPRKTEQAHHSYKYKQSSLDSL